RWPSPPEEALASAGPSSARARTARSSTTRRRTTRRRAATTPPISEVKQRENLKVSMLVEHWILQIQAKCSSIGIVVDRRILLILAVLLLLIVHMMIKYLLMCTL
uniref:Uncharacterized protein n=1 Tax=Oryza brachyantha TaxID=4533 RepID=J3MSJ4_ORYBR